MFRIQKYAKIVVRGGLPRHNFENILVDLDLNSCTRHAAGLKTHQFVWTPIVCRHFFQKIKIMHSEENIQIRFNASTKSVCENIN